MSKVSVDLSTPSPYIEKDSRLHRFKRGLSYGFAFRLIRRHFVDRSPRSLLEIGTGSGFFLDFFAERFPAATMHGVEFDERLLKVTQARCPRAQCQQGNAETFELSPLRFDLIVSYQVIEHLYEPGEMLTRARKHLAPGGLLIITTPNLDGVGARWTGKSWHGYRDDHVTLKGAREWRSLIESRGFRTVYAGSTFFSGVPWLNRLPLGLVNWVLLATLGSLRWEHGESFVGAFVADPN